MPTLQSSLGHRFTDVNELDLVVYDLINLSAKNNVAALFSVKWRLLGVVSWATMGMVMTFKTCMTLLHPTPYQVARTNRIPDSLFIHDPFMNTEIALPVGFVAGVVTSLQWKEISYVMRVPYLSYIHTGEEAGCGQLWNSAQNSVLHTLNLTHTHTTTQSIQSPS
ncbi:hypothetical protein EDD18DRAFT_1353653 [Armillaria luteobubalina]|uniref:Uncharacterized protein n=1 Tax=Armillaria luteobubalina TaxID=153913 RepID=A0AA39Q4D6_9AGAR|nr:hypothetical protein EDD18DRAFT_1353653 [Armillaria luteobubalina]